MREIMRKIMIRSSHSRNLISRQMLQLQKQMVMVLDQYSRMVSGGMVLRINQVMVEREPMVCFSCNEIGHKIKDCPRKNGGYTNHGPPVSHTSNYSNMECYTCGKRGHKSTQCKSKPNQYHNTAACQTYNHEMVKPNGNDVKKSDETYITYMHYPHRGIATVNGRKMRFMRDTGSSICICKKSCVDEENYIGTISSVMLADRSMNELDDAIVHVVIPGYSGWLKVCVMPRLVSELIIGNDWQTARRIPIMETEEPEEIENVVGTSTIIIETSANKITSVPAIVKDSAAVPVSLSEDHTDVKQPVLVIKRSEVESEEGDQPTQINITVKSALPVENNRSEEIVPEFSVAVHTRAQVKREVLS